MITIAGTFRPLDGRECVGASRTTVALDPIATRFAGPSMGRGGCDTEPVMPENVPGAAYSVVFTPANVADLQRDLARWTFTRPSWVGLFCATLVGGGLAVVGGSAMAAGLLVVFGIVLIAAEALIFLLQYRALVRAVRTTFAVGSEQRLTLGADTLTFEAPSLRTEADYTLFASLTTTRTAVLLSRKAGRTRAIIPRVLIDDDGISVLSQRIAPGLQARPRASH
jgi:hypothetical protein